MTFLKALGGAGLLIATALVGGTLIGSVMAAPGTTSDPARDDAHGPIGAGGEYCEVFLDTLASELGVERDALLPASKAAAVAAIDAAVANGDLDEERAEALKERIEAIEDDGCAFLRGPAFARGFAHGLARGFTHADVLDAAAEALGMSSAEVIDAMAGGASLQEIAQGAGVSYDDVTAAVIADLQADLAEAVERGLDQERADAILERVQSWLDDGGEPRPGPMRPGRWH
ncbi:MAG TPA: hypothetical protein VFH63_06315 [candidate division Zixibacteria bacterium]|nr:hypothetical protein [candidate division Zixibacteria bacterium]